MDVAGVLRRHLVGCFAMAMVGVCLHPSIVRADNPRVNILRVRLSPFPGDLFAVQTNTQPGHLQPFYGASLTWNNKELAMVDSSGTRFFQTVANRLLLEQYGGLGLSKYLSLALVLPIALFATGQEPRADLPMDKVDGTYLGDLRVSLKSRFFDRRKAGGFGAGASIDISLPTATPAGGFNGDRLPTLTARIILDYLRRGWGAALNAGFHVRDEAFVDQYPIGNEFWILEAVRFPFLCGRFEGIISLDYQTALDGKEFGAKDSSSLVLLTGLKGRAGPVTLQGSVGAGLLSGYGSPAYILNFGIGYEPMLDSGCRPRSKPDRDLIQRTKERSPLNNADEDGVDDNVGRDVRKNPEEMLLK